MRVTTYSALFAVGITQALGASFCLDTLEPISPSEVTADCYSVYSSAVPSCGSSSTPSCSSSCITSLATLASDIQLACTSAFVGMDSLMRRTIDGGLIRSLCPDYHPPTEFVDSTMEAPNIVLSTLYRETQTTMGSAKVVPTEIATDSGIAVAASTTAGALAVDHGPTPTTWVSTGSLGTLFPTPTVSAYPTVDNAGGRNAVAGWIVLAITGMVGAAMV